ncbi:MAG: methyltransferase [Gammaproteobacteria bacterium]|nr:methyltransferase [Gammaproteobacteria bacterium]
MTETTVQDPIGEQDSPASVRASVKYLADDSGLAVYHASVGGEEARLSMDGEFETRDVQIGNARVSDTNYTLDRNGFALVAHRSAIDDFYNQATVDSLYTSEVESLIGDVTGASRVTVFDHTRRGDTVALRKKHSIREPSAVVHNDYTDRSGPQRVRDILTDDADALLGGRFAIVNVWRAMRNPVLTSPLAICDADSLDSQDLVATERRARDRIGEIYLVRFNPAHRWWYFPNLQLDEAILIKTFDSAVDGRARFAVHTAFDDPTSPPGAASRESIETRALVFF